ncbi:D-alanyl-D-alanine carboxypeptidase (penicillin-binding protein 5/6) [Micromonospora coriariae]|uniref:D-alanyl-D-alanine carboxypeptidase (Penicillin-binding protein 5/6) n=1 Tax=Micromonospora coriariae TaxID=285665 RepID=A0A1C4Y7M4_9ACTN|nr:D-alanyl-D-alanine carboxypeptidase [Micromonospora coriariae]SCF16727.1 D-alanyl-D-alanine carboxypeptidase (penicillin-binding protein 5/6) [Micromonospora coriariae]
MGGLAESPTEDLGRLLPAPPARRDRRRLPWALGGLLVLLLLLGGGLYAVAPLRDPLPAPTVELTLPASMAIPGTAPRLPWPRSGQAMISVDGLGTLGAFGGSKPLPIASVTKVMTAYVILTEHPLAAGEQGPKLTVSAAQAAAYPAEKARGESLVEVRAGEVITERQALQAVLLPSANNMARILAAWDSGSVAAFVDKMNAVADDLGMSDTHYTDPSGLDPDTVSTARDQVILASRAMALPTFAEIVKQKQATIPVAGTVRNYNELVGRNGVVGIKTGSTDEAGGCLVFAAVLTVGGRKLRIVGAVLGQPGANTPVQLDRVFAVTRSLLRSTAAALAVHTLVEAGEQVATVRGPLGAGSTINAAEKVEVVGWPGLRVRLAAQIPAVSSRIAAGAEHGQLTATAGVGKPVVTTLRTGAAMEPPTTWERIRRHR